METALAFWEESGIRLTILRAQGQGELETRRTP
jgi:hypothetical protein